MAKRIAVNARRAIIGACVAGSVGLAGGATAQWHRDWNRGGYEHRDVSATLILNGERICIDGRSVVAGIAEALRCKGYRVSVRDGCIMVHYRGRAPHVSLVGCDYRLGVTRSRGCMVLRPYRIDNHFRDRGYDRDWRRDRHDNWRDRHRRDRGPSFRWRSCPTSGFSIRIGGR